MDGIFFQLSYLEMFLFRHNRSNSSIVSFKSINPIQMFVLWSVHVNLAVILSFTQSGWNDVGFLVCLFLRQNTNSILDKYLNRELRRRLNSFFFSLFLSSSPRSSQHPEQLDYAQHGVHPPARPPRSQAIQILRRRQVPHLEIYPETFLYSFRD